MPDIELAEGLVAGIIWEDREIATTSARLNKPTKVGDNLRPADYTIQ